MPLLLKYFPHLLLFGAVLTGLAYAYHKGYANAELIYQNRMLVAEQQAAKQAQGIQDDLIATERAWLNEKGKTKVIYREKIKKVTRTVKKYIVASGLDKCNIGDDGMHAVNSVLQGKKSKSE